MVKSFEPIIDEQSKVLILGTMPSLESLSKMQYYANPRNQFWQIIYSIFKYKIHCSYPRKVEFLKNKRIALWDVLATCNRMGSLDSNIRDAKPNDLLSLFRHYKEIKLIVFNGLKAQELFKKYFYNTFDYTIDFVRLPSTSPTPGKYIKHIDEKIKEWMIIKNYL